MGEPGRYKFMRDHPIISSLIKSGECPHIRSGEIVHICENCDAAIYEGELYYQICGHIFCEGCVEAKHA